MQKTSSQFYTNYLQENNKGAGGEVRKEGRFTSHRGEENFHF